MYPRGTWPPFVLAGLASKEGSLPLVHVELALGVTVILPSPSCTELLLRGGGVNFFIVSSMQCVLGCVGVRLSVWSRLGMIASGRCCGRYCCVFLGLVDSSRMFGGI